MMSLICLFPRWPLTRPIPGPIARLYFGSYGSLVGVYGSSQLLSTPRIDSVNPKVISLPLVVCRVTRFSLAPLHIFSRVRIRGVSTYVVRQPRRMCAQQTGHDITSANQRYCYYYCYISSSRERNDDRPSYRLLRARALEMLAGFKESIYG